MHGTPASAAVCLTVARERGTSTPESITNLLMAFDRGDSAALDAVFPLVYDELLVLARRQRNAWRGNATLTTTALVHEAYLKLVDQGRIGATSGAHFFAIAATAMRHILCNYARDLQRKKRGGDVMHVSLDAAHVAAQPAPISEEAAELLSSMDSALQRLSRIDERQRHIVECRFFAGMTVEETAAALDISPATVKRDWTVARAWLYREMRVEHSTSPHGVSIQ